jgi:hypothetical protein
MKGIPTIDTMVAKLPGKEQALNTAQYMEHDWNLC